MKAVILAAGSGVRIREHHPLPKGFIKIDNKPLILHSLEKLKYAGIKDILIVCGFGADYFEKLGVDTGLFTTIYNRYFKEYGNLYSWYVAKDWLDSDFLLLESDILYEHRLLNEVINSPQQNVILVSSRTYSEDEVYVEAKKKILTNMSKNLNMLNAANIVGEFVGINKISLESYQKLIAHLEQNKKLLQFGSYEEDGLIALTKFFPIFCHLPKDFLWCEIDNLFHLDRAKNIYREMKAKQLEIKNEPFYEKSN